MAQREITENGVTKLIIYTSINCKEYPGGKIQRKKVVQGIAKNSQKANAIERELIREIEREKARREAVEDAHSKEFSEEAYKLAGLPKELVVVPGAGHVDLYDRVNLIPFDKLNNFFKGHLK